MWGDIGGVSGQGADDNGAKEAAAGAQEAQDH